MRPNDEKLYAINDALMRKLDPFTIELEPASNFKNLSNRCDNLQLNRNAR